MVRTRLLVVVVALGSWLSTGCSNMSNTEKGVGLGGLIGAGVGTAVGAATGDTGTGAVVGGLLGAGVGGLAGADADDRERERADIRRAAAEAQATPGPVGLTDVVQLTQRGVSDDVIVNHIRTSRATYRLSTADIEMLKANHVSDRVINEMMNSQSRIGPPPPRTVIVHETAPTTVIYERGPYWGRPVYVAPPPPVGVGFHFHSRRR
jgi:predicted small secreted protein